MKDLKSELESAEHSLQKGATAQEEMRLRYEKRAHVLREELGEVCGST